MRFWETLKRTSFQINQTSLNANHPPASCTSDCVFIQVLIYRFYLPKNYYQLEVGTKIGTTSNSQPMTSQPCRLVAGQNLWCSTTFCNICVKPHWKLQPYDYTSECDFCVVVSLSLSVHLTLLVSVNLCLCFCVESSYFLLL